jgi:hypothetical protein
MSPAEVAGANISRRHVSKCLAHYPFERTGAKGPRPYASPYHDKGKHVKAFVMADNTYSTCRDAPVEPIDAISVYRFAHNDGPDLDWGVGGWGTKAGPGSQVGEPTLRLQQFDLNHNILRIIVLRAPLKHAFAIAMR